MNRPKDPQKYSNLSILKSVEIYSSISVEMRDTTVIALLKTVHPDHFDIHLFRSHVKLGSDWMEIVQSNENKNVIDNGFQKCTLQEHATQLSGVTVHHKQKVIEVLREQVSLALPESDLPFRGTYELSENYPW